MPLFVKYNHCLLQRGYTRYRAYLPSQYCQVGRNVVLKEVLWEIIEVGAAREFGEFNPYGPYDDLHPYKFDRARDWATIYYGGPKR